MASILREGKPLWGVNVRKSKSWRWISDPLEGSKSVKRGLAERSFTPTAVQECGRRSITRESSGKKAGRTRKAFFFYSIQSPLAILDGRIATEKVTGARLGSRTAGVQFMES